MGRDALPPPLNRVHPFLDIVITPDVALLVTPMIAPMVAPIVAPTVAPPDVVATHDNVVSQGNEASYIGCEEGPQIMGGKK